MAAAIHNFFIEQGSSFEIIFEYLDENGLPIPIDGTNDCVRLKLKDDSDKYSAWKNAVLDSEKGSLLTQAESPSLNSNQIKWQLPATRTKKFDFDIAIYSLDIVVGKDESRSTRLATGQISLIRDIFSTTCIEEDANFSICKPCVTIAAADSDATASPSAPVVSPTIQDPTVSPTPTPSFGSTPTPTPTPPTANEENLCDILCRGLDIFAELYSGSGIIIQDASIISGINIPTVSSGTIPISNTGTAVNIELSIDSLIHNNPSELSLFVQPPSGDSILLSYRNKINNYDQQLGTKFVFSNKAQPDIYLYNKPNNDIYINILQNEIETLPEPYSSLSYQHNFNHLINAEPGALSGNWNLFVVDHDVGASGSIGEWHLIVTYNPPVYIPSS